VILNPALQYGQNSHRCARIRKDRLSQSFSIIVVGGQNQLGFMSSVEILDEGATNWRSGPGKFFNIKMFYI